MRRRTATSIFCWVGSSWPRLVGIGAAVTVVAHATDVSAQAVDAPLLGVPTQANGDKKPTTTTTAAAPAVETPPAPPAAAPTPLEAAQPKQGTAAAPATTEVSEPLLTEDELSVPGYTPGYRRYTGLGMSPYTPETTALPGGVTPSYGVPKSAQDWSFRYSGFMTVSLQPSLYERRNPTAQQSKWAWHTPPMTIDEWYSFTSTNTQPNNWVNMKFEYGNSKVTTHLSFDTWNPTDPTSYYQIGSQYFINNAYVDYHPFSVGNFRLSIRAGMNTQSYGMLARYVPGIYVNPLIGVLRGIGETVSAEYELTDKLVLTLEHGVMTARNGKIANNIISGPVNGYNRPTWPAAWVHHAHAGVVYKSDKRLELQFQYHQNWSQDERVQRAEDNPVTRQMDESNIPDGRITILGVDARMISDVWGYLAAGVSYLDAKHAFPLKGVMTYGGDGEYLSDRFLGVPSDGTGQLFVAAINYGVSLGKIVAHPQPFAGDGPDIQINTGFHWATTRQGYANWNARNRYKGGIDAIYTFLRQVGIGARFDTGVPNSKDMDETFYVLATRLQLKTDWNSREQIQLIYAKWFFGSHTRNEGTGERTPERLDSQMVALNFNMWW